MENDNSLFYKTGLNDKEVNERIVEGKVNGVSKPASKSYGQIVKDNVCTLFNLLNFLIFIALVLVQAWSNLVFILIIIANILIGIYQEVKAKKLVDQLSILTKPTITVVRNGKPTVVDINEVVLDESKVEVIGVFFKTNGCEINFMDFERAVIMQEAYNVPLKIVNSALYRQQMGLSRYGAEDYEGYVKDVAGLTQSYESLLSYLYYLQK